jgi:hypothetical protein
VIRFGGVFQQNPFRLSAVRSFLFHIFAQTSLARYETKNPGHFVLRDFVEVGGGQ